MKRAPDNRHFVQVARQASEAMSSLARHEPQAMSLLLMLIRHMDRRGAVVASRQTLAEIQGVSLSTIKRAVKVLKDGQWVDTVRMGGKGGALAYAVNGRVAWADKRERMPRYAYFQATVLASESEQDEPLDGRPPLQTVPTIEQGEEPLLSGPGEPPPSQPDLDGIEPTTVEHCDENAAREELERRGQQRIDYSEGD